jgi:hypothetical protein
LVPMAGHDPTLALLIGGRSGSGKSSVAYEIHEQLSSAGVMHVCIEGDNIDLAYPPPWERGLAEQNLAAMWRNYRALGYRRIIYTNTVSVLHIEELAAALGSNVSITAVLLTARDATIRGRLAAREVGSGLSAHLERSRARALELDQQAAGWVHRVATDSKPVTGIAREIIALTNWTEPDG